MNQTQRGRNNKENRNNICRMFTAVARETCQFLVLDLRSYKQIKSEFYNIVCH